MIILLTLVDIMIVHIPRYRPSNPLDLPIFSILEHFLPIRPLLMQNNDLIKHPLHIDIGLILHHVDRILSVEVDNHVSHPMLPVHLHQ